MISGDMLQYDTPVSLYFIGKRGSDVQIPR